MRQSLTRCRSRRPLPSQRLETAPNAESTLLLIPSIPRALRNKQFEALWKMPDTENP